MACILWSVNVRPYGVAGRDDVASDVRVHKHRDAPRSLPNKCLINWLKTYRNFALKNYEDGNIASKVLKPTLPPPGHLGK